MPTTTVTMMVRLRHAWIAAAALRLLRCTLGLPWPLPRLVVCVLNLAFCLLSVESRLDGARRWCHVGCLPLHFEVRRGH